MPSLAHPVLLAVTNVGLPEHLEVHESLLSIEGKILDDRVVRVVVLTSMYRCVLLTLSWLLTRSMLTHGADRAIPYDIEPGAENPQFVKLPGMIPAHLQSVLYHSAVTLAGNRILFKSMSHSVVVWDCVTQRYAILNMELGEGERSTMTVGRRPKLRSGRHSC